MRRFLKLLFLASLVLFLAISCGSSAGGGSSGGSSGGNDKDSNIKASKKGLITVTAKDEGLLVHIDYSRDEEAENWVHNSINVQHFPDEQEEWLYQPVEVQAEVKTSGSKKYSEILFPFTKKDEIYRIWLVHMDSNYGDWGETRETEVVKIKAIGGLGEFDVGVDWGRTQYWSSMDDNISAMIGTVSRSPRLHLSRLYTVVPEGKSIKDYNPSWQVRAAIGELWGSDPSIDMWLPYEGDVINLIPMTVNGFSFKGEDEIFFQVKISFEYDKQIYSQLVFDNGDRPFADCNSIPDTAGHFPRISIKSTENDGSNDFVTEPVAKHVKEAQQSWGDYSNDGIPDPWYEKCDIFVEGETETDVYTGQVKVRGNWTTNYDKKSLRIKFDEKHSMLGLNGGEKFKNWILLAGFKDASLLRDVAALTMYKEFFSDSGKELYYSSDTKLVELEVNGVYMGVYILAEQQEAKRMGLTEPDKGATNTDIGYLIEYDSYYHTEKDLEQFEIDYLGDIKDINGKKINEPQKGYTIKSDINGAEQHDFIAGYMNNVWKICYELVNNKKFFRFNSSYELEEYTNEVTDPDDEDAQKACIASVMDLNSLADMYLFSEIICDPDLYLTSFFMDIDFAEPAAGEEPGRKDHKLRFEAPWDFDSTMGNKRFCNRTDNFADASEINELFAAQCQPDVNGEGGASYGNPWMLIFINSSWFKKLVGERWYRISQSYFADNSTHTISSINTYSASDYRPLYDFTRQLWGTPSYIEELSDPSREAAEKSQADSADYLKNWIKDRWESVHATLSSKYPHN